MVFIFLLITGVLLEVFQHVKFQMLKFVTEKLLLGFREMTGLFVPYEIKAFVNKQYVMRNVTTRNELTSIL